MSGPCVLQGVVVLAGCFKDVQIFDTRYETSACVYYAAGRPCISYEAMVLPDTLRTTVSKLCLFVTYVALLAFAFVAFAYFQFFDEISSIFVLKEAQKRKANAWTKATSRFTRASSSYL